MVLLILYRTIVSLMNNKDRILNPITSRSQTHFSDKNFFWYNEAEAIFERCNT